LLESREEECLVSGMAMPPAFKFGTGFTMARATSVLVIVDMVIVMNHILVKERSKTSGEASIYKPLFMSSQQIEEQIG